MLHLPHGGTHTVPTWWFTAPHRVAVASRDALLQDTPGRLHGRVESTFAIFLGTLGVAKMSDTLFGKKRPQLGQNPQKEDK